MSAEPSSDSVLALNEVLAYYRDLGVRDVYRRGPDPQAEASTEAARSSNAEPSLAVPVPPEPMASGSRPDPEATRKELAALAAEVAGCRRCALCQGRKQTVFSDGSPRARVMFVGEAPGADEDATGVPFVGRAGQLLTKMIESGMGLKRSEVYIANVLKCRPPGNRDPDAVEIQSCRGYLERQIELVRPEVLVGLGRFACQFLLDVDEGMMRLRGRWGDHRGIPVMSTFHPSYLLRQPEKKRDAWEDLQKVMRRLGLPVPARK